MDLLHYGLYFGLTLIFSTLFAMGGVGAAIALVPLFTMLGLPINVAKATGLFVNSISTITSSIMNFFRGTLEIKFALPLVFSVFIATPIGAWLSQYVPVIYVKWALVSFVIISALLLLFSKRAAKFTITSDWILYVVGVSVGLLSGMIGVGGGSFIMPLLILFGFNAKRAAIAVSFVIPFSTTGGFLTYLSFVDIDWILLADVGVAALIGGYIGERVMHFKLNANQIKKLIAIILLLLGGKLLHQLLAF